MKSPVVASHGSGILAIYETLCDFDEEQGQEVVVIDSNEDDDA